MSRLNSARTVERSMALPVVCETTKLSAGGAAPRGKHNENKVPPRLMLMDSFSFLSFNLTLRNSFTPWNRSRPQSSRKRRSLSGRTTRPLNPQDNSINVPLTGFVILNIFIMDERPLLKQFPLLARHRRLPSFTFQRLTTRIFRSIPRASTNVLLKV